MIFLLNVAGKIQLLVFETTAMQIKRTKQAEKRAKDSKFI